MGRSSRLLPLLFLLLVVLLCLRVLRQVPAGDRPPAGRAPGEAAAAGGPARAGPDDPLPPRTDLAGTAAPEPDSAPDFSPDSAPADPEALADHLWKTWLRQGATPEALFALLEGLGDRLPPDAFVATWLEMLARARGRPELADLLRLGLVAVPARDVATVDALARAWRPDGGRAATGEGGEAILLALGNVPPGEPGLREVARFHLRALLPRLPPEAPVLRRQALASMAVLAEDPLEGLTTGAALLPAPTIQDVESFDVLLQAWVETGHLTAADRQAGLAFLRESWPDTVAEAEAAGILAPAGGD